MTVHLSGPYPEPKDLAHQAVWKEKKVSNTGLPGQEPCKSLETSQYSLELLLPSPTQGGR